MSGEDQKQETVQPSAPTTPATYNEEQIRSVDYNSKEFEKDSEGNEYIQIHGGYILKQGFAGEMFKGLGYCARQFNDINAAIAAYSADKVLDMFNAQCLTNAKNKARNTIPKYDEPELQARKLAELAENNPIVFSANEAIKHVPGERELTTSNQWMNESKRLKAAGDFKGAKAALAQAVILLNQEAEEM